MNTLKLALGERDKKDSNSNPSKEKVFTISFSRTSNASASSSGSSFAICSPATTKHDYGHDKLGKRKFQVFVTQPKRAKLASPVTAARNDTVLIAPATGPFGAPQYADGPEYGGTQLDDCYYRPPQPRYQYNLPPDVRGGNPYAFFDDRPYYPHEVPYQQQHHYPYQELNSHSLALAMQQRPFRHHRYQANSQRPPLSHAEHFTQPYPFEPDDAQYNPIAHYHHHWRQPSVPSSLDTPDLPKKPILKQTDYEREKSVNNDLHLEANTTQNQYTDYDSDVDAGDVTMSHRLTFAKIQESNEECPEVDPTNSSYDCVVKIVRDPNQSNDPNENLSPKAKTALAYSHRDSLFCGTGVYTPDVEEVLDEVIPASKKQYEQLVDVEDVPIAKLALLGVGAVPMNAEAASQPACSLNTSEEEELEDLSATGVAAKENNEPLVAMGEVSKVVFEDSAQASSLGSKSGIPLAPPRKAGVGFIGEEILSDFDTGRRASRLPRTRQELMSMLESSFVSEDSSDILGDMSRKSTAPSSQNSHEMRGSFRRVNRDILVPNQTKHSPGLTMEMNLIHRLQDKLLENSSFAASESIDIDMLPRPSTSVEDSKGTTDSPPRKQPKKAPPTLDIDAHDVISEEISYMMAAAHAESATTHVELEKEEVDIADPAPASESPRTSNETTPKFCKAIQSETRISPQKLFCSDSFSSLTNFETAMQSGILVSPKEHSKKASFAISAQSALELPPESSSELESFICLTPVVSLHSQTSQFSTTIESVIKLKRVELLEMTVSPQDPVDIHADPHKLLEPSKTTCATSCFLIEPEASPVLQVVNQEVVDVASDSAKEELHQKKTCAIFFQTEVDFVPELHTELDESKKSELTISHQDVTEIIPLKKSSIRGAMDLSPTAVAEDTPVWDSSLCSFVASPQVAVGLLPEPSVGPKPLTVVCQEAVTLVPDAFDEGSSYAISGAIDAIVTHPDFSTSRKDRNDTGMSFSSYSGMSREEKDDQLIERIDAMLDERFQTLKDLKEMANKASVSSMASKSQPPVKSKTKVPRNLSLGTTKSSSSYSTASTYTLTSNRSRSNTKGSKSSHFQDISESDSLGVDKEDDESKSDSPFSSIRPSLHERFVISVTNKDKEAWKMKKKGPVWTRTSFGGFGLLTKFNRTLTDEDWKKHMTKRHGKPKPLKGYDFTCFYCRKTKKSYHLGKKRSQFELQCANPMCRKLYKVGL